MTMQRLVESRGIAEVTVEMIVEKNPVGVLMVNEIEVTEVIMNVVEVTVRENMVNGVIVNVDMTEIEVRRVGVNTENMRVMRELQAREDRMRGNVMRELQAREDRIAEVRVRGNVMREDKVR